MPEVSVERYTPQLISEWNAFVAGSKNGTFLFDRSYMDYHSNRFNDHSLMLWSGKKLSGIFVANENDRKIESHGGLTYGGLVLKPGVRLTEVIQMFKSIAGYYHQEGFDSIIYKCVPIHFHSFPANEDQFVLFALGASLLRRDTSSVIVTEQRLTYMHGRSQSVNEAQQKNFVIRQNKDCTRFWSDILTPNLRERHNADPVHTLNEINLLMSSFPENIRLFEISSDELMAGAVVYVHPNCVHLQYLSSTQDGRRHGALDLLVDRLVQEFSGKKYFSLGTSNNGGGPDLNSGLLAWKEGFGARTFVHDFYEIDTSRFNFLDRYG